MHKLDRIVEEVLIELGSPKSRKIVKKALKKDEEIFVSVEYVKTMAQAVAKAIFEEIENKDWFFCFDHKHKWPLVIFEMDWKLFKKQFGVEDDAP